MPKIRTCRECGEEFDSNSKWKREVKGYTNVCPWCTEEMGGDPAPEIRGFVTGSGKMQDISFRTLWRPKKKPTSIRRRGMLRQVVEQFVMDINLIRLSMNTLDITVEILTTKVKHNGL